MVNYRIRCGIKRSKNFKKRQKNYKEKTKKVKN